MSKITDDVEDGFKELEGWVTELRSRVQPAVAEVEKYADPFIQALTAGLASAGIAVPVKYADIALDLVSKLTQLDPAASAPASTPPAQTAEAAAPQPTAQ